MSVLTLEAKLERTESSTPWGFRMQGGKDFSSPLTIQKVNPGSLASKCGLQQGDIILKIGNISTDILRHKEAQESIIASGNRLDLLLQRIREKKKLNHDGGGAPATSIVQNYETFSAPSYNANALQNQPPTPSQQAYKQTFNAAPRPFGGSVQSAPTSAPTPFKPSYGKDDLAQRTSNLSISPGSSASSSSSSISAAPTFSSATRATIEKYSDDDDGSKPSQYQSKSFKYLQDLMESGKEPPKALKPTTNKALQPRSVSPAEAAPSSQAKPSTKPGTVKAIMSQRYNTPIGLYSDSEVMTQFEGQSKFLLTPENGGEDDDLPPPPPPEMLQAEDDSTNPVKYFPSETYRLIREQEKGAGDDNQDKTAHSRSFIKLQKQLDSSGAPPAPQFNPKPVAAPASTYQKPAAAPSTYQKPAAAPSTYQKPAAAPAAKPWTPAAPAPSGPRPFDSGVAPKPTGVGAKRGRLGDAVVSNPVAGSQNRIPVCSSCGSPIRGPFVTAVGNCWCPDHFVCANPQCGIKLIDIGFVEEGGFLYCERDYERYLAPHCKKCNAAIIGECVNALQSTWHPECFICAQCKLPIGGTQFHVEEGKPYCEKDWGAMFQTMCAGCDFPIEPGDRWVEALGKNFHSECFNCSTCQVSLEGQPFVAKGGKAFCKKHAR
ncbi:PDZ and LIM domain protein 7-like isoform X2 [Pomacea canaliculata]|uniref:PDZ and LIM domain protein 7-like isoform X2 n=1 Tax=Pomacea canaliculata TaxID=400727 RepID=UPI000D725A65|nr:PDZ and LIM domain protein 7-like isoform X2 [Pomacea canaliculata]